MFGFQWARLRFPALWWCCLPWFISPGSIEVCFLQKLLPVRAQRQSWLTARLFLECCRALSAGSAVFEGPPAPLISQGTPRRERALSPLLNTAAFCSCTPALHTVWNSEEPHQSHLSHMSTTDLIKRSFWTFPSAAPPALSKLLEKGLHVFKRYFSAFRIFISFIISIKMYLYLNPLFWGLTLFVSRANTFSG